MKRNLLLSATTLNLLLICEVLAVNSDVKTENGASCHMEANTLMQRNVQLIKLDCGVVCSVSDASSYKGEHRIYIIR